MLKMTVHIGVMRKMTVSFHRAVVIDSHVRREHYSVLLLLC